MPADVHRVGYLCGPKSPGDANHRDCGSSGHTTNTVEHPELVAWRIKNFARLVGKENVIAGTDCGFSQGAFNPRVHSSIIWAIGGGCSPRQQRSLVARPWMTVPESPVQKIKE